MQVFGSRPLRWVCAGLALAVVVPGAPAPSFAYDMLGAMRAAATADATAACPASVASLAEATAHSSSSDAMLVTLTAFVQSDAPADRRGTCLRSMRLLGQVFAEQDERDGAKGAKT